MTWLDRAICHCIVAILAALIACAPARAGLAGRLSLDESPAPVHFYAPIGPGNARLSKAIDGGLVAMKADAAAPYPALPVRARPVDDSGAPGWIKCTAAAGAGLIVGLVGWVLALLRARQRARRSAAVQRCMAGELALVLDNSLDVIWVLDEHLRIERVNAACEPLWGLRPDEIVGRSPFELTPPEDRAALAEIIVKVASGIPNRSFESRALRKDGSTSFMLWSAVWCADQRKMYCVGRDDSERRQLIAGLRERGEALQKANEDLDHFSRSVAHDLKAPLAAITCFVGKALEDSRPALSVRSASLLEKSLAAAGRMDATMTDLLALAHASEQGVVRCECDLGLIAAEVASELGSMRSEQKVDVTIAEELRAHADPRLMRVVLENLLGNAFKFSARAAAPAVEVGVERIGGEHVYFVRDNGAGFDMAYAHKLFRPFQRLHGNTEFAGTGLGLTIVHRIISRHGGRIWAEGAVQQGAVIRFTLGQPTPSAAHAAPGARKTSPARRQRAAEATLW